jgi:hypothetical protein
MATALCLAGCGSGSDPRAAPQPKLLHSVATALASRSDEVAGALAAGDLCRALSVAQQLQQETVAAINNRQVLGAFQEQLGSAVADLVSRIRCVPPVNKHDNGKHNGQKKKGEGND